MENEVRLIDANAMRQNWLENGENEYVYDTNAVLDSIDEQPTIDPESLRPKGHWKYYSTGFRDYSQCSVCKSGVMRGIKYPYCPWCGAKMEE